jgi:putative DNA primase/helicase
MTPDMNTMLEQNFITPTMLIAEEALLAQGAHDEGNAQCVHLRHSGKFVQNEALGWLHFTGTHWTQDGAEAALDRAIVETLLARIDAALKSGKADLHKDLISKSIPTSGKVNGAKHLLSSIVYQPPNSFDTAPDLLNCKNGVVNLRTGQLCQHNQSQRFTHCVAAHYYPQADYTAWVNWLNETVSGGSAVVDWLQMAVGYSLTGHTKEEVLFYLFGPPRSGKGTFTETLLALLDTPLAKEVNFGTFTAQRTGDSQNFDLAPLKPCRFVAASESNAYERFNEAKVKALTGGNEVYCAFKHKSHFNYKPQFKIWLSSNQPVNADPDDDAVWGRLRVIEFPHSHLGQENKELKEAMRNPAMLEGVLAWAVAGAMRWYKLGAAGLPELEVSANAKQLHREALDNVQGWIGECCLTGGDGFTSNSALYLSYERWCKENGIEPKKQKGFSQSLIRKGFQDKRTTTAERKNLRGFTGIGLA